MKEDLVIEKIRLCTNTYIETSQRYLNGEFYYRAYGHVRLELQGVIIKEEYLKLRNIVIEKDIDGEPIYRKIS